MKEYLYIEQLAERTPRSPSALRTMMARGVLKLGVHYFKPYGPHSRPIFKWAAVVEFIEGGTAPTATADRTGTLGFANGTVVNGNEAA